MANDNKRRRCPLCLWPLWRDGEHVEAFVSASKKEFAGTPLYQEGSQRLREMRDGYVAEFGYMRFQDVVNLVEGACYSFNGEGMAYTGTADEYEVHTTEDGSSTIVKMRVGRSSPVTTTRHVCARCGYVLPEAFFEREQVVIGLIGRSREGKTAWAMRTFWCNDDVELFEKFDQITRLGTIKHAENAAGIYYEERREKFLKSGPAATTVERVPPMIIDVDDNEGKKWQVVLCDVRGEDFMGDSAEIVKKVAFLEAVDAYIACIDCTAPPTGPIPISTPNSPVEAPRAVYKPLGGDATSNPMEAGQTYGVIFTELNRPDYRHGMVDVAVTLTKVWLYADEAKKHDWLAELDSEEADAEREKDIQRFLIGKQAAIRELDSRKFKTKCFAVSAYDKNPGDELNKEPTTARRVLEPLLWIMQQQREQRGGSPTPVYRVQEEI